MATAEAEAPIRGELARLIAEQAAELRREAWKAKRRKRCPPLDARGNPIEGDPLDELPGRVPEPWVLAANREAVEAELAKPRKRTGVPYWEKILDEAKRTLPRARVFVHVTGWAAHHERPRAEGEACEVCRGATLPINCACLACLRSGLDGLLDPVLPHERPKPVKAAANGLAGGTGKRARRVLAKAGAKRGAWSDWVAPGA